MRSNKHTALLLGLACWLSGGRALAGNDDGVLLGSEAALTAGAVTATVSDGTSAWYNPAGLTRLERQSLDLHASVYGVNLITASNWLTLPDGTQSSTSVVDWVLLPSALSYTRRLNARLVASFGVFMPKTTDVDLRHSSQQADGTLWVVGIDQQYYEYDYVLGLGVQITDSLSFGAALHGIYISQEDNIQVGYGTAGDPYADFLTTSVHTTTRDYGLRAGIGVQWTPTPRLKLGLSAQTPTLTGLREVSDSSLGSLYAQQSGVIGFTSEQDTGLKAVWELSTPMTGRLGLAYTLGNVDLLLDGSVMSRLDLGDPTLDRKLMGNLRLATRVRISDRLSAGLGAFSDLDGGRSVDPDYVGIAGGLKISSNYHVTEGSRSLTFITTLGGRYAYGFGETDGVRFVNDAGLVDVETEKVRIRAHELAFNLGGGVTF